MTAAPAPRELVETCARLHPALFGALALYCGDVEIAAELTQETLLRLWQRWPAVATMERPDRWVFTVAFNLARSHWRRRRVERAAATLADSRALGGVDPTDVIAVRVAVAHLPARQRAAIVLRYFDDLSVADTASVMQCAPGTVKALTHQAIEQLRASLALDATETETGETEELLRD